MLMLQLHCRMKRLVQRDFRACVCVFVLRFLFKKAQFNTAAREPRKSCASSSLLHKTFSLSTLTATRRVSSARPAMPSVSHRHVFPSQLDILFLCIIHILAPQLRQTVPQVRSSSLCPLEPLYSSPSHTLLVVPFPSVVTCSHFHLLLQRVRRHVVSVRRRCHSDCRRAARGLPVDGRRHGL